MPQVADQVRSVLGTITIYVHSDNAVTVEVGSAGIIQGDEMTTLADICSAVLEVLPPRIARQVG